MPTTVFFITLGLVIFHLSYADKGLSKYIPSGCKEEIDRASDNIAKCIFNLLPDLMAVFLQPSYFRIDIYGISMEMINKKLELIKSDNLFLIDQGINFICRNKDKVETCILKNIDLKCLRQPTNGLVNQLFKYIYQSTMPMVCGIKTESSSIVTCFEKLLSKFKSCAYGNGTSLFHPDPNFICFNLRNRLKCMKRNVNLECSSSQTVFGKIFGHILYHIIKCPKEIFEG